LIGLAVLIASTGLSGSAAKLAGGSPRLVEAATTAPIAGRQSLLRRCGFTRMMDFPLFSVFLPGETSHPK
jgi:hypothetical protein